MTTQQQLLLLLPLLPCARLPTSYSCCSHCRPRRRTHTITFRARIDEQVNTHLAHHFAFFALDFLFLFINSSYKLTTNLHSACTQVHDWQCVYHHFAFDLHLFRHGYPVVCGDVCLVQRQQHSLSRPVRGHLSAVSPRDTRRGLDGTQVEQCRRQFRQPR